MISLFQKLLTDKELTPPDDWDPPIGYSRNTWGNIVHNKVRSSSAASRLLAPPLMPCSHARLLTPFAQKRIQYCVNQFSYLSNREKCISLFTGPRRSPLPLIFPLAHLPLPSSSFAPVATSLCTLICPFASFSLSPHLPLRHPRLTCCRWSLFGLGGNESRVESALMIAAAAAAENV